MLFFPFPGTRCLQIYSEVFKFSLFVFFTFETLSLWNRFLPALFFLITSFYLTACVFQWEQEVRPPTSREPSWSFSLRIYFLFIWGKARDHFEEHLQGRSVKRVGAQAWWWAISEQHRLLQARNNLLWKTKIYHSRATCNGPSPLH